MSSLIGYKQLFPSNAILSMNTDTITNHTVISGTNLNNLSWRNHVKNEQIKQKQTNESTKSSNYRQENEINEEKYVMST